MKMWNTGETKGGRELKKWNYRGGGGGERQLNCRGKESNLG